MKNLHFLPSKTALVVLLVLLIAGAGIWFLFTDREVYRSETNPEQAITVGGTAEHDRLIAGIVQRDQDGDGLADWEETLWNTNPTNPDTDEDGTSDGDEVETGRDPTTPGPDDALPEPTNPNASIELLEASIDDYLSDDNRTLTDKVAVELFSTYSELKRNGTLDEASTEALLQRVIAKNTLVSDRTPYAAFHFTSVSESDTALTTYKKDFDAMVAQLSEVPESEAITLGRALDSNDETQLAPLDEAITVYSATLERLLTMSVPESALPLHVELTNNFSLLLTSIVGMRSVFDDPVAAALGLQTYIESANGLAATFEKFRTYFSERDVSATP